MVWMIFVGCCAPAGFSRAIWLSVSRPLSSLHPQQGLPELQDIIVAHGGRASQALTIQECTMRAASIFDCDQVAAFAQPGMAS